MRASLLNSVSPLGVHHATSSYEAWLGRWLPLVNGDLSEKHKRMGEDRFEFLRATFYRWAQRWPVVCAELAGAPAVLAVGDMHVENFGTWRDAEGRLVWGVNDVDDAWTIPYTNDLVRLATSAGLASKVKARLGEACDAILAGYADGLSDDSLPFVLAERHGRLRRMAVARLRQDPAAFWDELEEKLLPVDGAIAPAADRFLASSLPAQGLPYARYRRRAGLGSLGRPRFVALAEWLGGRVAREVKLLAPSSWLWANATVDAAAAAPIRYGLILAQAVRCPDPVVAVSGRWVVRRLAPDSSRIELGDLPDDRDELHLLASMGRELANIHHGSRDAVEAVRADLGGRPEGWLRDAAAAMRQATIEDFEAWRQL